MGICLFSQVTTGQEEITSRSTKGGFEWILVKSSSLEQAAQGCGGVTIPGSVQKLCGCGAWGRGLVAVLG